nr:uncharacterized protein LOC124818814 [Hydra vulgaris]
MASNKKPIRKSSGKQCAAYNCFNRSYIIEFGERKASGIKFFHFPKDKNEISIWCNLIKRKNGLDGFNVTNSSYLCYSHFKSQDILRAAGGTRCSLRKGAKPSLHSWNNFKTSEKERKPPGYRQSPPKSIVLPDNDVLNKTSGNKFVEHVLSCEKELKHYTGFPNRKTFDAVFIYLDPGENGENLILYNSKHSQENENRGRNRILLPLEAYLLTLVRLRRNYDIRHLTFLFSVCEGTVSNTVITWLNFMYIRLGSLSIWPTLTQVKLNMPQSMKDKFPNVKCIIDCLEIKVAVPQSLTVHKLLYSDYKSHTTVKILVGIAPGGGFTFISAAYPGSISDKEITIKSGLLNPTLWNHGEVVMADRGFTIQDYLSPLGVKLIIPSFLRSREQFTETEVIQSQQIASERIHVERMIQRLKCFHIFDRVIPLNMIGSLNQIVTVCGILTNFHEPIIKNADRN